MLSFSLYLNVAVIMKIMSRCIILISLPMSQNDQYLYYFNNYDFKHKNTFKLLEFGNITVQKNKTFTIFKSYIIYMNNNSIASPL